MSEALALAFWDNQYADGYQRLGGLSVSSNCYGYAFGLGTYVNDNGQTGMSVVLERCFSPTHIQMGDAVLAKAAADHAIKITGFQNCTVIQGHPPEKRLSETREKNRESPIYRLLVGCPGPPLKAHFGPVVNWPTGPLKGQAIPLGPYTLYKEKP